MPRERGLSKGAGEAPLPVKGVEVMAEVVVLNREARMAR